MLDNWLLKDLFIGESFEKLFELSKRLFLWLLDLKFRVRGINSYALLDFF